jgi:hypothetical protein
MAAAELHEVQEETAIAKVSHESMTIYDKAKVLIVSDQLTYNLATELYKAALDIEKQVHAAHDPVCEHWHKLHKQATTNRDADLSKVVEAKKLFKSKAAAWQDEQERIRREEERRLQEEARRKAEEEARIAREAAEAERKRLAAIEEEERLRLAAEAEAQGATQEQVTEILETPLAIPEPEPFFVQEPTPLPTVAPTYQKAAGFSVRMNYSAVVVDINELIRAAATNKHFAQYLIPNQSAINALAKATKDAFSLPGCALKKERV